MEHTAATINAHKVTYLDCISGKIGIPKDKKQKALFQLLLIFVAIPLTATINWALHTSNYNWTAFSYHLQMIPLMFVIAITVRFLIANPLIDRLVKTCVPPRLGCLKRSLIVTVLNILVMCTTASLIRMIITSNGGIYLEWDTYIASLPISYLISFVMGYFITTPLMKKFYARAIEPYFETQPVREVSPTPATTHLFNFQKPVEIINLAPLWTLKAA